MSIGDAIKNLRNKHGLTQADLAARLSCTEKTIRNWEKGETNLTGARAKAFADEFGFDSWEGLLAKYAKARPFSQQTGRGIPLFESVPAGNGDFDPTDLGEDNGYSGVMLDPGIFGVTDLQAFAVTVKGDSMMPTFADGEIVLCSPSAEHEPGMVAVFRLEDGDCGIKVIEPGTTKKTLRLVALNTRYATREVPRHSIVRLARVVAKTTIF